MNKKFGVHTYLAASVIVANTSLRQKLASCMIFLKFIGFAIWHDLTRTQSLNYAVKTRPTVCACTCVNMILCVYHHEILFSEVEFILKV